jgi:hypothetical protein
MAFSSFFDIAVFRGEDAVHCPDGTMILAFIQKRGIGFIRGLILESFCVQDINHSLPLFRAKGGVGRA